MNNANRTEILNVTTAATLYLQGGLGAWNRHEVRTVRVSVGPYAQHARAYFLEFTPKGARRVRGLVLCGIEAKGLIAAGHNLPECPGAYTDAVQTAPGVSVQHGRRMTCDAGWDVEARAALTAVKPLLDIEADFAAARETSGWRMQA